MTVSAPTSVSGRRSESIANPNDVEVEEGDEVAHEVQLEIEATPRLKTEWEEELKALRDEMAAAKAEYETGLQAAREEVAAAKESMKSEFLQALKAAKDEIRQEHNGQQVGKGSASADPSTRFETTAEVESTQTTQEPAEVRAQATLEATPSSPKVQTTTAVPLEPTTVAPQPEQTPRQQPPSRVGFHTAFNSNSSEVSSENSSANSSPRGRRRPLNRSMSSHFKSMSTTTSSESSTTRFSESSSHRRQQRPSLSRSMSSHFREASQRTPLERQVTGLDEDSLHHAIMGTTGLKEHVSFQPSLWDASSLIFTGIFGKAASAFVLILLILNVIGQCLFVYIVANTQLSKTDWTDETVDQLKTWRRTVAHHVDNYNPVTKETLTKRVCGNDKGLEMSTLQYDMFEIVNEYLSSSSEADDDDEDGEMVNPKGYIGVLMCTFAVMCWFMTIAKELDETVMATRATYYAPRGDADIVTMEILDDGDITLEVVQVTRVRKNMVYLFIGVRVGIALSLAYYGALFLTYEVDLGELLLNAVALEFVLNMDELIYASLVPQRVKLALQKTKPFIVPAPKSYKGLDFRTMSRVFFLTFSLAFIVGAYIMPQHQTLTEVWDAMCSGERDFVYTLDAMGTPFWTFAEDGKDRESEEGKARHRTKSWTAAEEEDGGGDTFLLPGTSTFAESVLDHVLQGKYYDDCPDEVCYDVYTFTPFMPSQQPGCCPVMQTKSPAMSGSKYAIVEKSIEGPQDANAVWNPICYDPLDGVSGSLYYNLLVGGLIDVAGSDGCGECPGDRPFCNQEGECVVANCAAALPFCSEPNKKGQYARMVCSQGCGCATPRGSLTLFTESSGCPVSCEWSLPMRTALAEMPCEDAAVDDPEWVAFVSDWAQIMPSAYPKDWRLYAIFWLELLRQYGCAWLTMTEAPEGHTGPFITHGYPAGSNLCTLVGSGFPVKPLSLFCPVSCDCRRGDRFCPTTCPARNDTEHVSYTSGWDGFVNPPNDWVDNMARLIG